jgi:hypothetical protein
LANKYAVVSGAWSSTATWSDTDGGGAQGKALMGAPITMKNVYLFECRDKDGNLKWTDKIENLVVNVGLDDLLGKYFKGSTYTAAHYVGLTAADPTPAAADAMDSHAGWTEVVAYDEATRPAITWGTVASQSVDNSASKARFTISTNTTVIGGAFVTTVSTKSGTTGILYGVGAFSAGNKTLDDNDTLDVTVTATAAAA